MFGKDDRMRRIGVVGLAAVVAFTMGVPAMSKALKSADAVLKLADLPEGWALQAPDRSKGGPKCLNWTQAINKGSSSAVRNDFETNSEVLSHAVAVHPTVASATAAFAALKTLVGSCSSFSYKSDGSKLKVSIQPMNVTPSVQPDQFVAWKYAVQIGSMTVSRTVVLYREETTVGFLADGGLFTDLNAYKMLLNKVIRRA